MHCASCAAFQFEALYSEKRESSIKLVMRCQALSFLSREDKGDSNPSLNDGERLSLACKHLYLFLFTHFSQVKVDLFRLKLRALQCLKIFSLGVVRLSRVQDRMCVHVR